MRRTDWKKIHSRRGASLFYALLFLLAAAMVSDVALSAATTNISRTRDDASRIQVSLSLESGARVVRKMLEGILVIDDGTGYVCDSGGPLGEAVKEGIVYCTDDSNLVNGKDVSPAVTIEITPPVVGGTAVFPVVKADITVVRESSESDKYRIRGTIWTGNSGDSQTLYLTADLTDLPNIRPVNIRIRTKEDK